MGIKIAKNRDGFLQLNVVFNTSSHAYDFFSKFIITRIFNLLVLRHDKSGLVGLLKPSLQEVTLLVVFLEPFWDLKFLLRRMIRAWWAGHSLCATSHLSKAQCAHSWNLRLIIITNSSSTECRTLRTHVACWRLISANLARSRTS